MRGVLLVLCILAFSAGPVAATDAVISPDQAVLQFDTKLGTVTFLHQKHADLSFTECTTCHHTLKPGEAVKPCHECHGKDAAEAPKAKSAFHTRCTGCHEYTAEKGEQAGPLKKKCKLCHIK